MGTTITKKKSKTQTQLRELNQQAREKK